MKTLRLWKRPALLTTQLLLQFFGFVFAVSYWVSITRAWLMLLSVLGLVAVWLLTFATVRKLDTERIVQ